MQWDIIHFLFFRSLKFDHGLILEREERIKQIEDDILDVHQLMREMGSIVHQQAESISKYIFVTHVNLKMDLNHHYLLLYL